ncbi:hypothetical protein [Sorangium sp. So ce128]|uniref:hypothetical protein n=1 Tax=Sorangium sp. So ce128 TaxID=3133281 RepID=UPI003F61CBC3
MKISRQCPKCQSRKLWVVEKAESAGDGGGSNTMSVASGYVLKGPTDDWGSPLETIHAGFFETWICALCGFTEWYARDANEALARLASHPWRPKVRYVDGEATGTPYR